MEGPGSVREARERLSRMQSLRQQKQYEDYQKTMYGTSTGSPFGINEKPITKSAPQQRRQQQRTTPQWPLAPANAPRHIITAASQRPSTTETNPGYQAQHQRNLSATNDQQSRSTKPRRKRSLTHNTSTDDGSDFARQPSATVATAGLLNSLPDFSAANNPNPPPNMPLPRPKQSSKNHRATQYTQFNVVSPIAEERASAASGKSYEPSHAAPAVRMSDYFVDDYFSDEEEVPPRTPYKASLSPRVYVEKPANKKPAAITASHLQSKPLPKPKEEYSWPKEDYGWPKEDYGWPKERPGMTRLPNSQYDPSKTSRHARGYASEKSSDTASSLRQAPRSMLGDRVGSRRPPNLDFEKPRAAPNPARSSLTSLSDLISRATKVRHNLARGKTASRLVTEWDANARRKAALAEKKQRDFLSSPGPSVAGTDWPSGDAGKGFFNGDGDSNRSRRSCNPMRSRKMLIFMMCFMVVVILSAAVVIPLVTIVIPRQQAKSAAAASAAACARKVLCANGGLATQMSGGSCGCTCVNGFQGATCTVKLDTSCASISANNNGNVSVGASIVPLLAAATGYNVPLTGGLLSDQFKRANMTCANENALVDLPVLGVATASAAEAAAAGDAGKAQGVSTINGIVVAATPTGGSTPAATAGSATSPPPAAITAAPSSTGPATNSSAQDFAKVGILFVLQDSGSLAIAAGAQQSLASFMDSAANGTSEAAATNVVLGNGYAINLWRYSVKVRNGTIYGPK